MGLTERQRKFVHAYATNGGNGTQAAKDAGYNGADNVVAVTACNLLKQPKIAQALDALVGKAIAKAERGAIADIQECLEYETAIMRAHKVATMLAESGELSVADLKKAPAGLIRGIKIRSTTDAEGQVFAEHSVTLESGAECARSIRKHLTGESEGSDTGRAEIRAVIFNLIAGDRNSRSELEQIARRAVIEITPTR